MSQSHLDDWLADLEKRTPAHKIELGLDRVGRVYATLLGADPWPDTRIITIGGTNGKGSTVAFCEAIAKAQGLSTIAYTSPHINRFNERVRINGVDANDATWLTTLNEVEQARDDIHLSYFEHVTLAALVIAKSHPPDVLILEVGLGGRLDAVNVVDADVSVITSIGLDHMDYLGPTRTHIGREKLGIARSGRPLVLAESQWPDDLEDALAASQAILWRVGSQHDWSIEASAESPNSSAWQLNLHREPKHSMRLPSPALLGAHQLGNAGAAIIALMCLLGRDQLSHTAIARGLTEVKLAGRFQQVAASPAVFLDVAHNAQAAQGLGDALVETSTKNPTGGQTFAVFGALADKDIEAMADALDGVIDRWWVGDLSGPRGQTGKAVAERLINHGVTAPVEAVKSIPRALDLALANASPNDRVVVFGSFHVLAEVQSRWPTRE
ncbi:MAG TPA: folylpolyglutamate synthase/dihydrofolate synthase family protein [Wenzhouxiangella sp.]